MKSASQPFSRWRYAHGAFIYLPRTIHGAEPVREMGFRHDYEDAMDDHCIEHVSRDGGISYCADAFNTALMGA